MQTGSPGSSPIGSALQSMWTGANFSATEALYPLFLLSLRVATILAMTPLLYAMPVPARVKVLIAIALSVALASGLMGQPGRAFDTGSLLESALREVALGATLALGILLAFAAFAVAGQMLDIQIGFGIAQVFDPVNNRPSPILVAAFNTLAVLVFFLVDGHHALLRGIAYSVERFPVGAAWSVNDAWGPILRQVTGMFTMGFALAAPVVFSILLVELALGVIARNLPQINMFTMGIPVKIVVGMAVVSLWFGLMGGVMTRVYSSIYQTWDAIFAVAGSNTSESKHVDPTSGRPLSGVP